MTSARQAHALEQLQAIASVSNGALEIVQVREPGAAGEALLVAISIDCRGLEHKAGGLKLRTRERLIVTIRSSFPLEPPGLDFSDKRHGGAPHVQWGSHICLYQAPDTEWQPEDGMYGFAQRVLDWLTAAAADELDPVGGALHPPVTYATEGPIVVPTIDTPAVDSPWWAGYAAIEREEENWVELGRWIAYDAEVPKVRLAPAILLPGDMPFEYPKAVADLQTVLEARGFPFSMIRTLLALGALRSSAGKPIYFILGAAMRGIAGQPRAQHLACWCVSAERSDELRTTELGEESNDRKQELFAEWAATANIDWCQVHEERPEIVISRDAGSDVSWWRGRRVAILGCGAIGSALAMLLGRAGVAKMQLYDRGSVKPGLLVRQLFDRKQLGENKATATAFNVRYTSPNVEVHPVARNVLGLVQDDAKLNRLLEAEVIIDATASRAVAIALEERLGAKAGARPPVISMSLGHTAQDGMLTCAAPGAAGLSYAIDRRTKLTLAGASRGQGFLDEFWPNSVDRTRLFQPEPGCSDPTFRGSASDVMSLVSPMLNRASRWLLAPNRHAALLLRAPLAHNPSGRAEDLAFSWLGDVVVPEWLRDYEIRLDIGARDALLAWIRRSERVQGPIVETGGALFGEVNEFLRVVWISEVSGPPPDSQASPSGFVCGVAGLAELNTEKTARSRGSVQFIGMWHTHPGGSPNPSETDRTAMRELLTNTDFKGRNFLMLIVGGSAENPDIAGGLYARANV